MSEGAAVSKRSMKIAFSVGHEQDADHPGEPTPDSSWPRSICPPQRRPSAPSGSSSTTRRPGCTLEAQDFFDNDRKMTYTCYEPKGLASVWTHRPRDRRDASTRPRRSASTTRSKASSRTAAHACVESDHQSRPLRRPGLFREHRHLEAQARRHRPGLRAPHHFNDYEGWKASNPVVSTDGRFMAFQVARTTDEAGVGYGLLLLRFD